MHYYSFHIGDYRGATSHLSNDEDLAYRRLIDMYYDSESPIPVDTQWVSRRLRLGFETIQNVLNDFFFLQEDGWHHHRCDYEIDEYRKLADKNRENGKKGGRPKGKNNPVGSQSVASGNPDESGCEGNHKPLTVNHEPLTNLNKNNASEDFQKQDESHLYIAPTRRTFEMFVGWKPEPKTWVNKLSAAQHRVKPDQFTDYIIAEFVRKNTGEESKTENQWQGYLIEAVIRGYIKPEGQEAKPTNQPKQPEFTPPVYKNWSDEPLPPVDKKWGMTPEQLEKLKKI